MALSYRHKVGEIEQTDGSTKPRGHTPLGVQSYRGELVLGTVIFSEARTDSNADETAYCEFPAICTKSVRV